MDKFDISLFRYFEIRVGREKERKRETTALGRRVDRIRAPFVRTHPRFSHDDPCESLETEKNIGNFKLETFGERYVRKDKFSILENEMDEDEEFFFFPFPRVNPFDGTKVYASRGIKWNGWSAENRGVRQSGYSFESICEMIEGQSREQIDRGRIRRLETSKESRRTSEARKRFTIQRIPVPEIVILPKHRSKNSRKSRRIKRRPVFCDNKRPRRAERRNGKLLSRPTCRSVLPLTVVYLEQLLLLLPKAEKKKKGGEKKKEKKKYRDFFPGLSHCVECFSILRREIVEALHSERSKFCILLSFRIALIFRDV